MAFPDYILSLVVPLILVAGAWLSAKYTATAHRHPPFPPGPKPRFIVGNLPDLPAEQPWITYTDWGNKYGDIVHASAFGNHVIIISASKIAAELFERRARIYSDRPPIPMVPLIGWDFDFTFLPYGEKWRQYRRLFHKHFHRDAIVAHRPTQMKKIHDHLRGLLSTPEDFTAHNKTVSAAALMATIYGYDIKPTHDRSVELAEATNQALSASIFPGSFAVNTFPFLRHLPSWVPGCSFQQFAEDTYDLIVEMRNAPFDFVRQTMRDGVGRSSVLAELLEHHDTHNGSNEEEIIIKDVAAVAYAVGADTTSAALNTFIMAMALHPEVVHTAQNELDSVTGSNRLPGFEDRNALPYCEAVYREVMRQTPGAPLGIPHTTTEDDIYDGYFIPKGRFLVLFNSNADIIPGATILTNIWAMTRDESIYSNAEEFNPERFFKADRQLNDDADILAFGFGRRICPGRHVADAAIWSNIVSVLSVFNITKAKDVDGNEIEIVPVYSHNLVSHPHPFKCRITPRSNAAKRLIEEMDL
ncbi:cytochrome P450 [Mycena vitilis]|nr:cytochrome P450 [Mycena vitilis]